MEQFTVKVPGLDFKLSTNQIYHLEEIPDPDAPDGYQKEGISKHPLPNVAEGIVVPHDGITWNTGFNIKSFCYRGEDQADQIFKEIKKHLIPELEALIEGDLTSIKSDNNQLFDEFIPFNGEGLGEDTSKFKIKGGNMFNTSNPLEFLALWWALLGKQIMPPGKEHSGAYKNCFFVLKDKKQSTSKDTDKEFDKTMALSTVMGIVKRDDKKELAHLQNVFTYVGLNLSIKDTEAKPLIATFSKWTEKGGYNNENAVEFNEIYDKFDDDDAKEELVVYVKLLEHIKSGKVQIERHDIFVDGENLGSDKKAAARKVVADKELHKTFLLL